MSNDDGCKFQLELTPEEVAGLNWLAEVLDKIRQKGPDHKSYEKAAGAAWALVKLQTYCADMHETAHELDARNMELAQLGMAALFGGQE